MVAWDAGATLANEASPSGCAGRAWAAYHPAGRAWAAPATG